MLPLNVTLKVFSDETMMTIHFSADLRPVVCERQGMLHWILDPACSGFIICYDVRGNQVLISNFDVGLHDPDRPEYPLTVRRSRRDILPMSGQTI